MHLLLEVCNEYSITKRVRHVNVLPDDPAAKFVIGRPIVSDVAGEFATKQAKNWIEQCLAKHKVCRSQGKSMLPTRVMDLGLRSDTSSIKLHISKEKESADYSALSYCWGESRTYVLITRTLGAWTHEITVEKLPKTLQVAIEVTRELSIRYLWVDALCIIQDSAVDKEAEIGRMGTVYKNAKVTIAAATARGVSEGFLSVRKPLTSCTIPFLTPDGPRGSISLAAPILAYKPQQPLDSRGWTLQEFLLSPRVLMYGASELTWHCQSENFQTIEKNHIIYHERVKRLPHQIFNHGNSRGRNRNKQVELWASIVEEYTTRYLTDPGDKLPAIAGLANELMEIWEDRYICGMWQSCLINHLGWSRSYRVKNSFERSDRGPSWSWISMDCQVLFEVVKYPDVEVRDCIIEPTGSTFVPGHKTAGRLVLHAKILSTRDLGEKSTRLWHIHPDLDTRNTARDPIYYLLLGSARMKHPVGLLLTMVGSKQFRRVG